MDLLVTYSILSLMKERLGNVRSLIEVFQELCESILAEDDFRKTGKGVLEDLKKGFMDRFMINIPNPTLKAILKGIQRSYSMSFELFSDFSYSFDNVPLRSLKRDIEEENRSIQELKDMYRELCREKGLQEVLGIDIFVEANKRELVSYLNNQEYQFPDRPEFTVIKVLCTVPDYRKRIERLVLGSLISSYVDLDIETVLMPAMILQKGRKLPRLLCLGNSTKGKRVRDRNM